jgi:hypothetical protein
MNGSGYPCQFVVLSLRRAPSHVRRAHSSEQNHSKRDDGAMTIAELNTQPAVEQLDPGVRQGDPLSIDTIPVPLETAFLVQL